MYRNVAVDLFGERLFEHALFYNYEKALRFELSTGGSAVDMFLQAFTKANEIAGDAFATADDLFACVSCYCSGSKFNIRPLLKSVARLGVDIPIEREFWVVPEPDEDNYARAFLLFPICRNDVKRLMWGAIASDLGVRPVLKGRAYIYSLTEKLLIHPYDDRGMDVIGEGGKLKGLYQKFNDWLLDYDRAAMTATFETDI